MKRRKRRKELVWRSIASFVLLVSKSRERSIDE